MKNLEQIRAKNALKIKIGKGSGDGDAVAKKVPTMIRENGFLGALAFAIEKEAGYADVFTAIAVHLAELRIIQAPPASLTKFFENLASVDAQQLRTITAESMAYLNYVRRFH